MEREGGGGGGGTMLSHFSRTTRSEYGNAVYGYLRMIILKNLPIHQVTDPEVRRFSKIEVNIGHGTVVKVILLWLSLLSDELRLNFSRPGALLFDRWSCNGHALRSRDDKLLFYCSYS